MCDVQMGELVVFGVKDETSNEWQFAIAKVKIRKVKSESFIVHYLEPYILDDPGGKYKEAYNHDGIGGRLVQWKVEKQLEDLLCRITLPASGKLGEDVAIQLTNRVKKEYSVVDESTA
jgi:hypothetical protein